VELAAEILENRPAAEGVLFVNLPSWTSPARNTYAAGVEYVTLMGGHVSAEDLIAFNLYQRHPVTAVEVADLLANPGFAYDTHVEKRLPLPVDWAPEGSHVIINHYTTEGITAEYAGELHPEPAPGPAQAAFGPYELLAAAAELCAGTADVTLHWRVTGPDLPPTISVFSQLISDGGQLVGQLDQPPLQLRPDLLTGMQAWSMVEYRQIAAEQTPAALLVGVYDYVTGERFTGVDRHNAPLVDDAFAIPVTACAPNGE